jgi:Fic family protein
LDAKNHLEAIEYLYEIVTNEREISEGLIKELNALILADEYVDPLQVQPQMEELISWVDENEAVLHPLLLASIVHYNLVRIHAFDESDFNAKRFFSYSHSY